MQPAGIEATFLSIAQVVPGFAGVFVGADDRTRIAITQAGRASGAIEAIRDHYAGSAMAGRLETITITRVPYNYVELLAWKAKLLAALATSGASGFAVHVTTNTVDKFSPSLAVDRSIQAVERSADIPTDAVRVLRLGRIEALSDLKDEFTPGVPGGAGIELTGPTGTRSCTLGVNVKLTYDATEWDALTAAHCTQTMGGGSDNTTVHQGADWSNPVGYVIGHEIADPDWSSTGCDTGDTVYVHCRWADVAVVGYDGPRVPDSGYVAVTIKRDSLITQWVSKD